MLKHGKTCEAIFEACRRSLKTLRQMNHHGVAIEHYCFDRAGLEGHERLWRQWHAEYSASLVDVSRDVPLEVLKLTEFVLATACSAHDAQSAFRWGMRKYLLHKELLRDSYVSVEALRNSMDILIRYLGEWIALRLSFASPMTFEETERWRNLWQVLDVELETVEVLSEHLQLRFHEGRLLVSQECSSRPDLIGVVSSCLLSVWKFVRFTESRFLTAGSSSRTVVAALLLGIEDLVKFIATETSAPKLYLNGFFRLQGDRNTFMAEAALISRVTDGVLADLLEGSRVARRHDDLWQTLSEDLKWLIDLPFFAWQPVSSVGDATSRTAPRELYPGGHTLRLLRPPRPEACRRATMVIGTWGHHVGSRGYRSGGQAL